MATLFSFSLLPLLYLLLVFFAHVLGLDAIDELRFEFLPAFCAHHAFSIGQIVKHLALVRHTAVAVVDLPVPFFLTPPVFPLVCHSRLVLVSALSLLQAPFEATLIVAKWVLQCRLACE